MEAYSFLAVAGLPLKRGSGPAEHPAKIHSGDDVENIQERV